MQNHRQVVAQPDYVLSRPCETWIFQPKVCYKAEAFPKKPLISIPSAYDMIQLTAAKAQEILALSLSMASIQFFACMSEN
jgi:hypothetical protein